MKRSPKIQRVEPRDLNNNTVFSHFKVSVDLILFLSPHAPTFVPYRRKSKKSENQKSLDKQGYVR
jgi:hypothetical protein